MTQLLTPFFLFSIALANVAHAQTTPAPCAADEYAAFDFWVGDWDVFALNADGARGDKAGENKITREENGCLLVERWTSATGGTGQSYNFFDPGAGAWRQVWVAGAATIDYSGGLNESGEMVFEGEIAYRNGVTAPFKGIWTPLPDGSVKQHFEQYDAEKKQWAPWFTGLYLRQETSE